MQVLDLLYLAMVATIQRKQFRSFAFHNLSKCLIGLLYIYVLLIMKMSCIQNYYYFWLTDHNQDGSRKWCKKCLGWYKWIAFNSCCISCCTWKSGGRCKLYFLMIYTLAFIIVTFSIIICLFFLDNFWYWNWFICLYFESRDPKHQVHLFSQPVTIQAVLMR